MRRPPQEGKALKDLRRNPETAPDKEGKKKLEGTGKRNRKEKFVPQAQILVLEKS